MTKKALKISYLSYKRIQINQANYNHSSLTSLIELLFLLRNYMIALSNIQQMSTLQINESMN